MHRRMRDQAVGMSLALLTVLAAGAGTGRAGPIELIVNGGFEQAGGSFAGWTVATDPDGAGDWFLQSGTASPLTGLPVPAPPGGTYAAMTDAFNPNAQVLYQDITVPAGPFTAAVLRLDLAVSNSAADFAAPGTLAAYPSPYEVNQQARVDLLVAGSDPFTVDPADLLLALFQTRPGDPLVFGYDTLTVDVTALLAARPGQAVRLRFAQTANDFFFQFGVDGVSLAVTPRDDSPSPTDPGPVDPTPAAVPEPSALVLLGLGAATLAGWRWAAGRGRTQLGGH